MKQCEIKLLKKTCVLCHDRRARYRYRGRVRWNPQHNVCFQCRRSYLDRLRAAAAAAACAATEDGHTTFPVSPDPMLAGFERGVNAAALLLLPCAGASGLVAAEGTAQAAA